MPLTAKVFRCADGRDCTNGGWSSRIQDVIVLNCEGPCDPASYTEYMPVLLQRHRTMPALHIVAEKHLKAQQWTMFGGNFLYCSDSRFRQLCTDIMMYGNGWPNVIDAKYPIHEHMSFGAIPIHDRIEG